MAKKPSHLKEKARYLRAVHGLSTTQIAEQLNVIPRTVTKWVHDIELTPEQRETIKQRKYASPRWTKKKPQEQEQARQLRKEGLSIKQISQQLNVSTSSVVSWVRDIELTDEQKWELKKHIEKNQPLATRALVEKHRDIRRQHQEEGRIKAREGDLLHAQGCMLYWGEGGKGRNSIQFVNSDPVMMRFFMKFLRESLSVPNDEITFHIYCYTNNGLAVEQIEQYWLEVLELPASCKRKTITDPQPKSSQQKSRKLIYGVCKVGVTKTRLVQHIYGAIQEYTGIDKPEWLE
jgi:transposase